MTPNTPTGPEDRQRLDLWLWHARFFKTRALAARAVSGGHVKVGGERAKAGHRVKVGDRLEILRKQERFVVSVAGLPGRRGPAAEASAAYVEDADAQLERERLRQQLRRDRLSMPQTNGRPDKHTRRLLRRRNRSEE